MISFFEAAIASLSIHRVGNRLNEEGYVLSEAPLAVQDELLNNILMQYFVSPFTKTNEVYRFYHASDDLNLNAMYHFAEAIFDDPAGFHEGSTQIAKYLYEAAAHPKIKGGELYVALFRNLQIEGELLDAIGIFKSETKETYLKVSPQQNGFGLAYDSEGIDIRKLDKGCLVFNSEKEQGYKVAVVDNTNRGQEAVYWKDDFLKLRVRNDSYHQTNNVLGVYKNFVTQKIDQEFEVSKADKIDLLNRSMKYFKENENFDIGEFSNEVIGNEQGIASFLKYKKEYEDEFETPIPDTFDINSAAVKKQNRVYKSVLKLDKNFHIYIHGNKELIEKGFDENKNLNYYKVYFKEEE
ncbi:MAG: nucleoid-associated protein [Bacteroidetes bacterium]|nr:nucleoid-associated protein [Bacteroidota bacterium]